MNKLILIFGFLILVSCNQANTKHDLNKTVQPDTKSTDKSISKDLGHGFKITFSESEDFTDFKAYWGTKLYKDNTMIFNDSTKN